MCVITEIQMLCQDLVCNKDVGFEALPGGYINILFSLKLVYEMVISIVK